MAFRSGQSVYHNTLTCRFYTLDNALDEVRFLGDMGGLMYKLLIVMNRADTYTDKWAIGNPCLVWDPVPPAGARRAFEVQFSIYSDQEISRVALVAVTRVFQTMAATRLPPEVSE